MAGSKVKFSQKRFAHGIADYLKEDSLDEAEKSLSSFVMAKAVNYRNDPQAITLLPGAVKESGSVVVDLIKWGDTVPTVSKYFFYGNAGNLYQRTSAGSWSNLHTAASSHGNGLAYFTGDDYLYYPTDSSIGRYGPVQGSSPQFVDDFLKAQGGVPTNTNSLSLTSASSQYATAANSVSLQITGDLTLEAYFNATTLPTINNSMTLLGKWDESTNIRSYKMDLFAISGYFGNGQDGAWTISTNQTYDEANASFPLIFATCTGTVTNQTLSATNASFAQGQVIFIHQTQGTNAGQWERNTIQGYTAGTITLGTPLLGSYGTGAQVIVLRQFTNVTVNGSITLTAKAWNGTSGGILAFLASGTVTVTGTISANGANGQMSTVGPPVEPGAGGGFRGGISAENNSGSGGQGEGTAGVRDGTSSSANGNGGGGGTTVNPNNGDGEGGGGGGNSVVGTAGTVFGSGTVGAGGTAAGSVDLTNLVLGGGGGGGCGISGTNQGSGANGGAAIVLTAVTLTVTGAITANGGQGGGNNLGTNVHAGGGGGAGGSILLKAQTATLGSGLITASGGVGGTASMSGSSSSGGAGAAGRIHLDYYTSYTGTTTPTLNATQDNSLVTTVTYQARLGISNDGTAFEYASMNLSGLSTGTWNRLSVSYKASTSIYTFYLNGVSLGTFTGSKTAISSNTALLYLGANKTSVVANFLNGLIDDVRIWNNVQTAAQILANNQLVLQGSESGLQAYYKLDNNGNDSTTNANNLTLVNTPTYSTNVPFPGATTRLDIDNSATGGTNTYTLPTAISEGNSDTLSIPWVNDPQKSMDFQVNAAGTGNWTLTIHDQQNNVVTSQTISNGSIPASGYVEFIFATPWRPLTGKTYHCHLTVSAGTSSVKCTTAANFSTANYHDYFGFLVTDTAYHPAIQFLNFVAIGNERYIAKWDGAAYSPNAIVLPPGWRVRCFAYWREYLAIGVWKGTNIYDYPYGRIYFWDGISPTFNFFLNLGEGQVNAMYGQNSNLYAVAGYRTYLYDIQGAYYFNLANTEQTKLKRLPSNQIPETDTQEIYPGAMTMWRSMLHIGLDGTSNSTTVERGVYSWGTYNKNYQPTLSYDYPISTGNTGSTVSIGCVYPAGKQLIIGWQDGIAYGADVIDFANNPAPQGYIQLQVQDDGEIWHPKLQLTLQAAFAALRSGESVSLSYKMDRASSWTTSAKDSTVGDTQYQFNIQGGRAREYQLRADLYATGTTSPTLLGISLLGNTLEGEAQLG